MDYTTKFQTGNPSNLVTTVQDALIRSFSLQQFVLETTEPNVLRQNFSTFDGTLVSAAVGNSVQNLLSRHKTASECTHVCAQVW